MNAVGDLAMLLAGYRMKIGDELLEKRLSIMLNLLVIGIWSVTMALGCLELRKRFRKLMFASIIVNAIGLGTSICFSIFIPHDIAFQIGELLVASVARQLQDIYISATSSAQVLPVTIPVTTTSLLTSTPPPPPPDTSTAAPMNSVSVTSTCCSTDISNKVHEEIGKALAVASSNAAVETGEMDAVTVGQHIQQLKVYKFPVMQNPNPQV